jgi:plastocyanin
VKRLVAVAATVALVGAGAGACSNRESPRAHPKRTPGPPVVASSGAGGVQVVTIEVDDGLRFRPSVVEMRPGKLLVRLHDGGDTPHNLRFADSDRGIANVESGQTSEATFTVTSPGTYSFVCTYHERLGMRGSLVVR